MPSIGGNALAEQDLLTLVRVFEVDPTLKNKKITLNEFSKYLNTKYLTLSGGTLTGPVIVNATLTVSGDTSLANVSSSGNATFNNVFVQNNLTVTGTATAADVIGTTKVSGATITGDVINATSGLFQVLTAINQIFGGNLTFSGNTFTLGSGYFSSGISVTGTVSGNTLRGDVVIGTTTVSGTTVTGNTALFTSITGSTLRVTTPSGASPAMVCSGIISGGVNGLVVKGPLIILP